MTGQCCQWCSEPIPAGKRADAKFCSKAHRQASHRFAAGRKTLPATADGPPLRLAYADPPYPGKARRYYADHADYAGEVDHAALVDRLQREFPDGWALSTSASALPAVLALCPPSVHVAAWFCGERPTASYQPLTAWEPVIYSGGRLLWRAAPERRLNALVHVARPRTTDPARVVGAKPAAFCWWLFALLGAQPGDEIVDLFPGSGGVARAWAHVSNVASSDTSRRAGPARHVAPRPGDASCAAEPDTSTVTAARPVVQACAVDASSTWSTRRVALDVGDRISA